MRFGINVSAPQGAIYAPDAFAAQIGKLVPLKLDDATICSATVADVKYSEDRRVAVLTLVVDDAPEDENRVTQLFALAMLASRAFDASYAWQGQP